MFPVSFENGKEEQQIRLIEKITEEGNMRKVVQKVKSNKGAPGVDKMSVYEIDRYFDEHKEQICESMRDMKYKPLPVKRVYIPKPNGKKRPLGIPAVRDRVVQQAVAQKLNEIYEPLYSDHSYGFRPNRNCHGAIREVLGCLNDGYQWVIDLDIQSFFDEINHDKLISILREQVNDKATLHLIRSFLREGVLEDGLIKASTKGSPQGGPLSVTCSLIYLDKLDKELEARGLRFVRYADDCNIFVKSEKSAYRVMKSIASWLEKKLFLKVSPSKTKVVRPSKSEFLGFGFWNNRGKWECKPANDRKEKLMKKIKYVLSRRHAIARPLSATITKLNQIIRGWINYFRIGAMKTFLKETFGPWLRHKLRVVILKQWKNSSTINRNLLNLNTELKCNLDEERIRWTAGSRKGWYARANGNIINFILNPKYLATKQEDRPGLVNPLEYYLK